LHLVLLDFSTYQGTGDVNPADILSKHWGYSQIREHLKSLLFWKGDTTNIKGNTSTSQAKGGVTIFCPELQAK
jgi:hypothetical protein